MYYQVHITPRAHAAQVEEIAQNTLRVRVRAPAQQGKANQEMLRLIAEHFSVPVSLCRIVSGHISRHKIIDIAL